MLLYVLALIIYQALLIVLIPPLLCFFYVHDKISFASLFHRLGIKRLWPFSVKARKYWVHASSIGEFNALEQVLKHLPREQIFITVMNNKTYHKVVSLYGQDQVAYSPIDCFLIIMSFIYYNRPKVYIGVESEIWPCQLLVMRCLNIKSYLVNAGFSDRSFSRYKLYKKASSIILNQFDKIYVRRKADYAKFKEILGHDNALEVHWNLKFDVELKQSSICSKIKDSTEHLSLGRKIIVLGSSHTEDELYLFNAVSFSRKLTEDFFFVIVPRHPERKNCILNSANDFEVSTQILSKTDVTKKSSEKTDFLIIDKFGVLQQLYSLAHFCIVGGSFSDLGGHNPIEPALSTKPIFIGPRYHSFTEVVEYFKEHQCLKVLPDNPKEFVKLVRSISADRQAEMGERAKRTVDLVRGSSNKIAGEIIELSLDMT